MLRDDCANRTSLPIPFCLFICFAVFGQFFFLDALHFPSESNVMRENRKAHTNRKHRTRPAVWWARRRPCTETRGVGMTSSMWWPSQSAGFFSRFFSSLYGWRPRRRHHLLLYALYLYYVSCECIEMYHYYYYHFVQLRDAHSLKWPWVFYFFCRHFRVVFRRRTHRRMIRVTSIKCVFNLLHATCVCNGWTRYCGLESWPFRHFLVEITFIERKFMWIFQPHSYIYCSWFRFVHVPMAVCLDHHLVLMKMQFF